MIPARVVVVEDERVVALHLKQQLTRLGYEVPAIATSGSGALQAIRDRFPDIVLMDIHIEGEMDGIETAAAIPSELHVPVVYLTAYSEESTLERARGTRPYGYLLKPFSERELHATLQMVLERRRADAVVNENEQRLERLVAERTADLAASNEQLKEQTALRLQAEYERHEAQKMETIGQLTGGVAHDFNNVLSVIVSSLEILQRWPDLPPVERQRVAAMALRSAQRGATLTQHLLAFSRRQSLEPKPMNLNIFLGTISDLLQRTLGETVTMQTTLAGDLWWTFADASQVESALLNLILNARDAMENGGKLSIETANAVLDEHYCAANPDVVAGEYAVLAVSDDGVGMTPELTTKVFEPFFTTKSQGQGTGLGLSQVYGFVKQSGGHVKIYSEPGVGTTVKLYLPRLLEHDLAGDQAPVVRVQTPKGIAEETILVVEDDNDVRANTIANLRELGYNVLDAVDGQTALDLLRDSRAIHLLFTDVGLPGMNGKKVADEARRLRPGLRVLFTSGYAHSALVHQGRLDPGVEVLDKPFTFDDLAMRIRRSLDGPAPA